MERGGAAVLSQPLPTNVTSIPFREHSGASMPVSAKKLSRVRGLHSDERANLLNMERKWEIF